MLLRKPDVLVGGKAPTFHVTSLSEGCRHPKAKHDKLDMGIYEESHGIPCCEIIQDVVALGWFGLFGTGNFMLRRWTTGEILMVSKCRSFTVPVNV